MCGSLARTIDTVGSIGVRANHAPPAPPGFATAVATLHGHFQIFQTPFCAHDCNNMIRLYDTLADRQPRRQRRHPSSVVRLPQLMTPPAREYHFVLFQAQPLAPRTRFIPEQAARDDAPQLTTAAAAEEEEKRIQSRPSLSRADGGCSQRLYSGNRGAKFIAQASVDPGVLFLLALFVAGRNQNTDSQDCRRCSKGNRGDGCTGGLPGSARSSGRSSQVCRVPCSTVECIQRGQGRNNATRQ